MAEPTGLGLVELAAAIRGRRLSSREATLAALLETQDGDGPGEALVSAAVAHGARDNVTAVVVDVPDMSEAAPA